MSSLETSCLHPMAIAIVIAVGTALIANPVSAQEMEHSQMNMPMPKPAAKSPAPAQKAAVKAPIKKTPVKQASAGKKAPAAATPKATDAKSMEGMDHSSMPMPAGSSMPGMGHSTMPADDKSMEGMDHSSMQMPAGSSMPGMDHSTMPGVGYAGMTMAPTQPREPIPVLTDADRAAAVPPVGGHAVHDNSIQHYVLFDRLEGWDAAKGAGQQWEGRGWIGTDLNQLWLRTEGQRADNKLESADLEVLYGHSFATWWDVVAGIRHDFKPGRSQDFASIGVIGLVPYKYDVEATAYIGQAGQTSARVQATYDTLLTGRLILQSLVEVNLFGRDDSRRGIGSGLSTLETGYRLRYEFTRRFAPYIGIVQERAFGKTADFRREEGIATKDTRFVAGIRIWF